MTTNRLAKSEAPQQRRSPQEWCDRGNAYLRGEIAGTDGKFIDRLRSDVEWTVKDGKVTIGWRKTARAVLRDDSARKHVMDRRGQPMSDSDTFALNKELEKLGAKARYRPDGSRYFIESRA